jgi:lysyl-tRNA synthetase class I
VVFSLVSVACRQTDALTLASRSRGYVLDTPYDQEKTPMSEEIAKTPADHIGDTLTQLKEMRHYSKNNVELYDGELSKLKQADRVSTVMDKQNALHDALETTITELEDVLEKMQPPPEA